MKAIGVVRKVDVLGRIVIPVELRRNMDIEVKDSLEIYTEDTLKEKNTEDNIDNAQLIVSIKTGEFIKYSLITILAILFICILTITFIRKKE